MPQLFANPADFDPSAVWLQIRPGVATTQRVTALDVEGVNREKSPFLDRCALLVAGWDHCAPGSGIATPQVTARTTAPVPLKLSLVVSRYQGEKKISSAPYTLW